MEIPFTAGQFLRIFQNYNSSVWPMQIVLLLGAIGIIYVILKNIKYSSKIAAAILALLWFWMGIVYHLLHFTSINKAAYLFGSAFVIQAFLFLYSGLIRSNVSFRYQRNIYGMIGSLFVVYALLIYPMLAHIFGHNYPQMPTFGVPCPTVIFTFGILLWVDKKIPKYLLIVPFLWSMVGFSAAVNLQIKEDLGLFVAGLLSLLLLIMRERKLKYNQ
ncbi:MAG TPA: DUF6064 family protein [Sulfurovum sp.]|uniref:DUF6064 family protein n=1 Tax=Sulfurovum sp. TaxID=1969726 RepID=UPI002F95CFB0